MFQCSKPCNADMSQNNVCGEKLQGKRENKFIEISISSCRWHECIMDFKYFQSETMYFDVKMPKIAYIFNCIHMTSLCSEVDITMRWKAGRHFVDLTKVTVKISIYMKQKLP